MSQPPENQPPEYQPPQPQDPVAPPTAPMIPVPPPPPPTMPTPPPAGGFAVPAAQYPGGSAPGGFGDPLVLPPGSNFSAWFAKVQEVAKRSWKSALIISLIGIAAPNAIVSLVQWLADLNTYIGVTAITTAGDFFSHLGSLLIGIFITIIFSVLALFVAAAGWAAGTWALVQEASGQRVNIADAFRYGAKKALSLGLWTILVGVMILVGICACVLPAVYLSFALSLFGFVAIFERGQNPIARSFKLTHADIGPTLGKVAICFATVFVYSLILGAIFGAIQVAIAVGTAGSFGYNFASGIIGAIRSLAMAPGYAVLLLALLPTYAELRAREAPLSTAQLRQELAA